MKKIVSSLLSLIILIGASTTSYAKDWWNTENIHSMNQYFEKFGGVFHDCNHDDLKPEYAVDGKFDMYNTYHYVSDPDFDWFFEKWGFCEHLETSNHCYVEKDDILSVLESLDKILDKYFGTEIIKKLAQYHPIHLRLLIANNADDVDRIIKNPYPDDGYWRYMRKEDYRYAQFTFWAYNGKLLQDENSVVGAFSYVIGNYLQYVDGFYEYCTCHCSETPNWAIQANGGVWGGSYFTYRNMCNDGVYIATMNAGSNKDIKGYNTHTNGGNYSYAATKYLYDILVKDVGYNSTLVQRFAKQLGIDISKYITKK